MTHYKHHTRGIAIFLTIFLLLSSISIVAFAQDTAEIKNIIYMIGDGMGPNQLESYKHATGNDLVMETFPIRGKQDTRSFLGILTDSAAGGTALATGVRTWVNAVGVYAHDPFALLSYPKNIRELAQEQGMKTGIVVTKVSDDATPAAFSAHTYARGNKETINAQQLASGMDVLMGAETGYLNAENAAANGFDHYVTTNTDLQKVSSGRVIGQFDAAPLKANKDDNDTPKLDTMTQKALSLLENPDGFFLMVEGSTIDSYCHENNFEGMYAALAGFDSAVSVALDYASKRNDTIVVITADHETGDIQWNAAAKDYAFNTGGHSAAPVPYFVYAPAGADCSFTDGEDILNKDIPVRIVEMMQWDEALPQTTRTSFGSVIDPLLTCAETGYGALKAQAYSCIVSVIPEEVLACVIRLLQLGLDEIIMALG